MFKQLIQILFFTIFVNLVFVISVYANLTKAFNYKYLGHSASNEHRNGWFNETQGIDNVDRGKYVLTTVRFVKYF